MENVVPLKDLPTVWSDFPAETHPYLLETFVNFKKVEVSEDVVHPIH